MDCTSCGNVLEAQNVSARFPCPGCGEETIGRCTVCKKLSRTYECKKCGFQGP